MWFNSKKSENLLGVLFVFVILIMLFGEVGKFFKKRLWIVLIGTPIIFVAVMYLLETQGG